MKKPKTTFEKIFWAAITALFIQQIIIGRFIALIIPSWPAWLPGQKLVLYLAASIIISGNVIMISGKSVKLIGTIIGMLFVMFAIFFHAPYSATHYPAHLGSWSNVFEIMALGSCYFIIADSCSEGNDPGLIIYKILPLGRYIYGLAMVVFGLGHFLYVQYVSKMVPDWMPAHYLLTYLAGAGLLASGISIFLNVKMKLASIMLGFMIFSFILFLHLPDAIKHPATDNGGEWTGVFTAMAFSSSAFYLAGLSEKYGTVFFRKWLSTNAVTNPE
jgi:hypothetical protein